MRVALPLPPQALGPAGEIGAVLALEHQPFDRRAAHAAAQALQVREPGDLDQRREIHARRPLAGEESLQPQAALDERQRPQVLGAVEQDVVEMDEGRIVREHARPVTALRLRRCCRSLKEATSPSRFTSSSPSSTPAERHRLDQVREGGGDVVATARVEPHAARGGRDLHADAVPFPLGEIAVELGRDLGDVLVLDRMGQHQRPEHRHVLGRGPRARGRRATRTAPR